MKNIIAVLALPWLLINCSSPSAVEKPIETAQQQSIDQLIQNLEDSQNKEIMVVAHRGDWRNAPENSLQAIQNCIEMGVDMVEIDVRKTQDGQLVLMHDVTIDRTTTGEGNVSEWTLDSLKTLRLVDGLNVPTDHQIPTLEEALFVAKDKILINLDKSYDIFDQCFAIAEKTGTLDQIVIKGSKPRSVVEAEFGEYLDQVYFMPILHLPNPQADSIIQDYLEHRLPIAFEFVVASDTVSTLDTFDEIRAAGAGVWVNSLWSHHCAGHDDRKAALDPTTYDWFINRQVDMIQTDRPALLIQYLQSKQLHS